MQISGEAFNRSGVSRFINSPPGRVVRFLVGVGFLVVGYVFRYDPLGIASMVWSVFPLSAGTLDICFMSAILGGPLSGAKIRQRYQSGERQGNVAS